MNINYKESQFEFFPDPTGSADESGKPRLLAARLTLSMENLVIFAILSIMCVLFSFTIGVERGKRLAAAGPDEGVAVASVRDARVSGTGRSEAVTTVSPQASPAVADVKDAKPTPVQIPVVTSAPTGSYTIQVASYKTEESARKEASHLRQNGFNEVYVLTKGSYVILCVGNFDKKEDASLEGKKLRRRYKDNYVRRL